MKTVGAVLIVKNEEEMLTDCLRSVMGLDEIVVCDTGSTDDTVRVARRFTDKVYTDYQWQDNFAHARNHAKNKATSDWILSIDADEVLSCSLGHVYKAVELGINAVQCTLQSGDGRQTNAFPRLFRNCPEFEWTHAAHNLPNVNGEFVGGLPYQDCLVKITYRFSPAHLKDPDRTLRILKKAVEANPRDLRDRYYLAREHAYKRQWEDALFHYGLYVQHSSNIPEKADAFLAMAEIYWYQLRKSNDARDACAQALILNPHFREAALFMARLAGEGTGDARFEKNAAQWRKMAESADNSDVLFVRA